MPENNTSEIDEIDDLMRRIYARRELEIAGRPAQRFQVTLPDGSVYNLVSESVYRDIMTRAEAAERRVAELEAQLASAVNVGQGVAISVAQHYEAEQAAGKWRPVSERPDSSACLYEVTVRASWDGDVFMTHGNLYMPHDGPDILRWRPAPPQE